MLQNLLPGIRDTRAPFSAGLLWLGSLTLYLQLHEPQDLARLRRECVTLIGPHGVGRPLLAAAAGFIAYLVGTLTVLYPDRGRLGWAVGLFDAKFGRHATDYADLGNQLSQELKRTQQGSPQRSKELDVVEQAARLKRTVDYVALRGKLLTKNEQLFLIADRREAEASFRVSVALPLVAATIIAAPQLGVLPTVAAAACIALLVTRGIGRSLEAREIVRNAVLAGVIEHPLADLVAKPPENNTVESATSS